MPGSPHGQVTKSIMLSHFTHGTASRAFFATNFTFLLTQHSSNYVELHINRRVWLRQDRTQRNAASRQPALQDHRRPHAALDGAGDEHRLRRLGRIPGRPAAGDGLPRPCRGRRHYPEDQGPLLSRPPRRRQGGHAGDVTALHSVQLVTIVCTGCKIASPGNYFKPLPRRDLALLADRDQQAERPHYAPTERLAILELRAARGWSLAQTASIFQVTPATIASWTKRLDEEGPDALLRTPEPINKFPDFVRYLVQRLQTHCPRLGKVKIAQILARAGLHLAVSTV